VRANVDIGSGNEIISSGAGFSLQDGTSLVYISGENDRLGIIQSINLSTCRIFGYSRKDEIVNNNVKMLMPNIYEKHHDEFIRTALSKSEDQITSKERSIYGKHISGYVFPLGLQIKFHQSFLQGKQFIASLKVDKKAVHTSVAHLITNPDFIVTEASSCKCIPFNENSCDITP